MNSRLPRLKEYTLENTCPILADFYKVNIVIHTLEYNDDTIIKIFNPCANKSDNYHVEYPRIDILVKKDDLLDYDHACLINPQDSTVRDSFFISFHSTSKKAIFLVLQSISR